MERRNRPPTASIGVKGRATGRKLPPTPEGVVYSKSKSKSKSTSKSKSKYKSSKSDAPPTPDDIPSKSHRSRPNSRPRHYQAPSPEFLESRTKASTAEIRTKFMYRASIESRDDDGGAFNAPFTGAENSSKRKNSAASSSFASRNELSIRNKRGSGESQQSRPSRNGRSATRTANRRDEAAGVDTAEEIPVEEIVIVSLARKEETVASHEHEVSCDEAKNKNLTDGSMKDFQPDLGDTKTEDAKDIILEGCHVAHRQDDIQGNDIDDQKDTTEFMENRKQNNEDEGKADIQQENQKEQREEDQEDNQKDCHEAFRKDQQVETAKKGPNGEHLECEEKDLKHHREENLKANQILEKKGERMEKDLFEQHVGQSEEHLEDEKKLSDNAAVQGEALDKDDSTHGTKFDGATFTLTRIERNEVSVVATKKKEPSSPLPNNAKEPSFHVAMEKSTNRNASSFSYAAFKSTPPSSPTYYITARNPSTPSESSSPFIQEDEYLNSKSRRNVASSKMHEKRNKLDILIEEALEDYEQGKIEHRDYNNLEIESTPSDEIKLNKPNADLVSKPDVIPVEEKSARDQFQMGRLQAKLNRRQDPHEEVAYVNEIPLKKNLRASRIKTVRDLYVSASTGEAFDTESKVSSMSSRGSHNYVQHSSNASRFSHGGMPPSSNGSRVSYSGASRLSQSGTPSISNSSKLSRSGTMKLSLGGSMLCSSESKFSPSGAPSINKAHHIVSEGSTNSSSGELSSYRVKVFAKMLNLLEEISPQGQQNQSSDCHFSSMSKRSNRSKISSATPDEREMIKKLTEEEMSRILLEFEPNQRKITTKKNVNDENGSVASERPPPPEDIDLPLAIISKLSDITSHTCQDGAEYFPHASGRSVMSEADVLSPRQMLPPASANSLHWKKPNSPSKSCISLASNRDSIPLVDENSTVEPNHDASDDPIILNDKAPALEGIHKSASYSNKSLAEIEEVEDKKGMVDFEEHSDCIKYSENVERNGDLESYTEEHHEISQSDTEVTDLEASATNNEDGSENCSHEVRKYDNMNCEYDDMSVERTTETDIQTIDEEFEENALWHSVDDKEGDQPDDEAKTERAKKKRDMRKEARRKKQEQAKQRLLAASREAAMKLLHRESTKEEDYFHDVILKAVATAEEMQKHNDAVVEEATSLLSQYENMEVDLFTEEEEKRLGDSVNTGVSDASKLDLEDVEVKEKIVWSICSESSGENGVEAIYLPFSRLPETVDYLSELYHEH